MYYIGFTSISKLFERRDCTVRNFSERSEFSSSVARVVNLEGGKEREENGGPHPLIHQSTPFLGVEGGSALF